jgi:hypothetical protein
MEVGAVVVSEAKYRFCIFSNFYLLSLFLLENRDCGKAYQSCEMSTVDQLFIPLLLFVWVCGLLCRFVCCDHNDSAQVHSTSRSIIEQPQTVNRSNFVPINSVAQSSSDMQNSNLRHSTETQLRVYNNCRIERASITSSLPPAYNIVMRENSVTISEEYQSMLPPSYNDFMRRINENDL